MNELYMQSELNERKRLLHERERRPAPGPNGRTRLAPIVQRFRVVTRLLTASGRRKFPQVADEGEVHALRELR